MASSSLRCLVRAELRKIALQRLNWALPVVAVGVGALAATSAADVAQALRLGPAQFTIDVYRSFAAAAAGTVMLAVTARLVAEEYEQGTIRVVLARGVGRVRLLVSKLLAVGMVGALVLVVLAVAGAADVIVHGPSGLAGRDVWAAAATVTASVAVCGLLGAAAAAVGRSMTFAMAAAIGFFPTDNGLGYVLQLLQNATQERLWGDVTTYQLGPALNHLPVVLMGRPGAELVAPEYPVDTLHSVLVVAGWAAAFAVAMLVATAGRDTLE